MGDEAKIGAGSVVVKPVPAGATIVGVPGHVAGRSGANKPGAELEHGKLPDPVLRALSETLDHQGRLEERVRQLEGALSQLELPLPRVKEPELTPACKAGIRQALQEVIEPEAGIDVVELGLIDEITLNGQGVEVRMGLPHEDCAQAGYLVEQVRRKVKSVTGDVPVEVVLA